MFPFSLFGKCFLNLSLALRDGGAEVKWDLSCCLRMLMSPRAESRGHQVQQQMLVVSCPSPHFPLMLHTASCECKHWVLCLRAFPGD